MMQTEDLMAAACKKKVSSSSRNGWELTSGVNFYHLHVKKLHLDCEPCLYWFACNWTLSYSTWQCNNQYDVFDWGIPG